MTTRAFTFVVGEPPATKVVYSDGTLTNGGTHATISAAIAAAVPGDVIELRYRIPGAATWAQTITMNTSGTAAAPITIRVRDGDSVTLSTSGTLLAITGSNVIVKGNSTGRTGLILGNSSLWASATWNTSYPQTYSLTVSSANVTVENATCYGARTYEAAQIYGTASQVVCRNVKFDLHGTNNSTVGDDRGDIVNNSGLRTVFEDCEFARGGHNLLNAVGPYQVYRRCTFDASWAGMGTGFNGCRGAVFGPGNTTNRKLATSNPGLYGPQLVEDCIVKNVAPSAGQPANVATKMQGLRIVMRGNYFWDNQGAVWNGPGYGDAGTDPNTAEVMARGYGYHNTSYISNGVWTNIDAAGVANANHAGFRFVNNVFTGVANGINRNTGALDVNVVNWDANAVTFTGYANRWKDTVWRDNIFTGTASLMNFNLTGDTSAVITDGSTWSANVTGNDATAVTFRNVAARNKAGFEITSGAGYQDAAPLTTTVGTGSGTTLTVLDAGYFYDGWGITGETGDWVKVGNNAPVRVTAVNWTTNTLTLASAISWANGDSVFYAGNSKTNNAGTVFDNRGAWQ